MYFWILFLGWVSSLAGAGDCVCVKCDQGPLLYIVSCLARPPELWFSTVSLNPERSFSSLSLFSCIVLPSNFGNILKIPSPHPMTLVWSPQMQRSVICLKSANLLYSGSACTTWSLFSLSFPGWEPLLVPECLLSIVKELMPIMTGMLSFRTRSGTWGQSACGLCQWTPAQPWGKRVRRRFGASQHKSEPLPWG